VMSTRPKMLFNRRFWFSLRKRRRFKFKARSVLGCMLWLIASRARLAQQQRDG
jgi:hypothetical protein